jgi:choline-phosphate cytidylyltransferase
VDLFTRVDLFYPGAVATAKVGLGVKTEGDLVISGTRGYVYVPAPWWKTDYFEMRYENPEDTERNFYKFAGDGLRYEIVAFLNHITSGRMEANAQALSIALARALECYRSGEKNLTI